MNWKIAYPYEYFNLNEELMIIENLLTIEKKTSAVN